MPKKKPHTKKGSPGAKQPSRRAESRSERLARLAKNERARERRVKAKREAARVAKKRSEAAKKGHKTRQKRNEAVRVNIAKKFGVRAEGIPRSQDVKAKGIRDAVREETIRNREFLNSIKHLSSAEQHELILTRMAEQSEELRDEKGEALLWVDLSEYRKRK